MESSFFLLLLLSWLSSLSFLFDSKLKRTKLLFGVFWVFFWLVGIMLLGIAGKFCGLCWIWVFFCCVGFGAFFFLSYCSSTKFFCGQWFLLPLCLFSAPYFFPLPAASPLHLLQCIAGSEKLEVLLAMDFEIVVLDFFHYMYCLQTFP